MTTIVTRAGKGSPLTNTEVDSNFTNLNTAKIETLTSTDTSVTITGTGSSRNLSVPINPNVVSGPASATDNAVVRFDTTTGKLVQNSSVTIDDSGNESGTLSKSFTPTTAPSYSEGRVWYDSTEKALAFYNDSSTIAVHVGQDLIVKVINNTGSTIPNGSPVYITSTSSGQTYPNVALAKADVAATSAVIGLTNGAIANGAIGYVTSQGTIDNVNTSTFTVGQVLYLSPYSAGQLMNTLPPTGITVQVGLVSYVDSSAGKIYVKQTTPLSVPASIISGTVAVVNGGTGQSSYTDGQLLIGNSTGNTLTKSTLTAGTGISVTNGAGSITIANTGVTSVTGTAPIVSSGGATPAISMAAATTAVNGYLTSIDWNTFNNKQPAGSYLTSAVTSAVAGTGVSVSGATGAVTFSIGQAVATTSNTQFNSLGVGTAASATAGEIRATNNVTAYYSDERLKTKIGNIENALDKVNQIETMVYHANETAVALGYDASVIEVGVTAQSVERVQPQVVAPAPIDAKYLTVRYERLVPLLIEAIKELSAEVKTLKAKVGE